MRVEHPNIYCRFFKYPPEDGYCTLCHGSFLKNCCCAGGGCSKPYTTCLTAYSGTRDKIDKIMAYEEEEKFGLKCYHLFINV